MILYIPLLDNLTFEADTDSLERAADALDAHCRWEGRSYYDGKVLELSFDVETREPESFRWVTDEARRYLEREEAAQADADDEDASTAQMERMRPGGHYA